MTTETKSEFTQLCVWPGTVVTQSGGQPDEKEIADFVEFFKKEFGVRVKWAESVTTIPDGTPNSGGRIDAFFYIHNEDIGKFAIPRLQAGIRWWEDIVDNENINGYKVYADEVYNKYPMTWGHVEKINENNEDEGEDE